MMLTLCTGNDSYLLREGVRALTHPTSIHIDCSLPDAAEQLERLLKYPSFLGEQQYAVLANAAQTAIADLWETYGTKHDTVSVIAAQSTEGLKTEQKKALARIQQSAGSVQVFDAPTGAARNTWIRAYSSERSHTIAAPAVAELQRRVGSDTWRLAQELEKLCAWTPSNGEITLEAIASLVAEPSGYDEWALSNAIAAYDKRGIAGTLWQQLAAGMAPQQLIGMVSAGIRNLRMVKDLSGQGKPAAAIAKVAGIHPFVVGKTMRGAATADAQRLASAHERLATLDRTSKDGLRDVTDGLFDIVLTL